MKKSKSKNQKKLDTAHIRREWQANVYASALLAPAMDVHALLVELGFIKNSIISSFNLDQHFEEFEKRFGLSRQATEIRLNHLGIAFSGAKYKPV